MRLFLNPDTSAYLRGLAEEFNESTNSVRVELNRFEEAGMLFSEFDGNKKVFKANPSFPLFQEVRNILLKQTGLQEIIDEVIEKLGDLSKVYLTGDLALGKQSDVVSLVLVGNPDRLYLTNLISQVESLISKKIQYLIYSNEESKKLDLNSDKNLLLWNEK